MRLFLPVAFLIRFIAFGKPVRCLLGQLGLVRVGVAGRVLFRFSITHWFSLARIQISKLSERPWYQTVTFVPSG